MKNLIVAVFTAFFICGVQTIYTEYKNAVEQNRRVNNIKIMWQTMLKTMIASLPVAMMWLCE